ncbi:WXG100 family type VII secretion target [Mycobacterium tuberculosis]|uniref:WXG100 family type VII secretion target n=1 Tax=Mycobacterium tuberculosis TaxID=1773 RepID=UPI001F18C864|nr:WXG100 family type VII secretion target [Mycobacterium tuberculosis]
MPTTLNARDQPPAEVSDQRVSGLTGAVQEDEARRMWASAQNISGAGWSGMAEATSLDTMAQMNQAFRNIVNMLHGVRDGLVRDANNYEQQEQASQQILSS